MSFRSVLFTPATRLDRLDKALAADPDWVALDIEDGVGPGDKASARDALTRFAAEGLAESARRLAIRINSPGHPEGVRDLAAMLDWPAWPGLLILPKVEAASQVRQLVGLAASRDPAPAFLFTIETAAGVANAVDIARAAPRGSALGYGSADHMAETGGEMKSCSQAFGRAQVVNAAAVAGLVSLDGVWLDYRDGDGLRRDANLANSMGFDGKFAIHPEQVGAINEIFSPTSEEVAEARALLAAARKAGGGAFGRDGKMIDAPVLARAERIANFGRRAR